MPKKGENIYKRKDGRWEGRYKCGVAENGRTKYRSIYAHSYQEVKEKLVSMKAKTVNNISSGKMTVKELFSEWLYAAKLKIKETSYYNYKMKADKHILPFFGDIQYRNLTSSLIHEFISVKINSGLSPKYVSDIIIIFKTMSKYISRVHGYSDPLANVILPKTVRKESKLLNECEQKRLISSLYDSKDRTGLGVVICYYTGLRIGELCGLQWSDIDFEKNILTVNRTVQRIPSESSGKATKLYIGSPKSISSKRTIPLPKFLVDHLKVFKGEESSFILSGTSKVVEPRTMQYRFKSILKKLQLPLVNFHCLRHMFATNCVKVGFDVKTLSEILGHASVETTLNRYVHSSLERKVECMNLLEAVA